MKLQPNYSYQKYEAEEMDEKTQFQNQLQTEHIQVANAINATIDDSSYWTRERQTAFTWVDGSPIYTRTLTGLIVGSADTSHDLGVTMKTLVSLTGTAQDTVPMTAMGITLPYINAAGNDVGLYATPTTVHINAFDGTWNGYTFYITVKYTKARS